MMRILSEFRSDIEILEENFSDTQKNLYIKGIFLQADIENRNGRIYRLPILQKAVNEYNENYIKTNRAYGELGHPNTPSLTINLDRVSHIITELVQDGKNFIGKAKIVDTPMGNIAKGLLKSGANLGVSSRGFGSLKENNGVLEVEEGFKLCTAADIVADPSAPDAFVNGILENYDWVYDISSNSWYKEKIEETRKKLHKKTVKQINENKIKVFEMFIKELTKNN